MTIYIKLLIRVKNTNEVNIQNQFLFHTQTEFFY
jgi:hypothetical protein